MPVSLEAFKNAFSEFLSAGNDPSPEVSEDEAVRREEARAPVALRATVVSGWAAARAGVRRFANAVRKDDDLADIDEVVARLAALDALVPDEGPLLKLVDAYEASDGDSRESAIEACREAAKTMFRDIRSDARLGVLESNTIAVAGAAPAMTDALRTVITALR